MHDLDKRKIIERYETRQRELGVGPAALGEPKQRQFFFFSMLLDVPEFARCTSILDLGCGYGDLHAWLQRIGWQGRYVGIDIVPALVEEGRKRHPKADLRVHDLQLDDLGETFDWVMSAGALGSTTEGVDYYEHLADVLGTAWRHCRVGLSFDLFSPLAEYRNPLHQHVDLHKLIAVVSAITGRFTLRHDYMPFAFATYLYKENAIDRSLSIFDAWRPHFDKMKALQ
jgi:SAM-dependent methyltransferase